MNHTKTNKKETAVFFLGKQQGVFYKNSNAESVSVQFPEHVLYHGEVRNRQQLTEVLQNFIQIEGIEPSRLLIILDKSITFEKTIDSVAYNGELHGLYAFADLVPFERPLSKIVRYKNRTQLIAANSELLYEVKRVFTSHNFSIIGFIPLRVYQQIVSDEISMSDVKQIFAKYDKVKEYSLLEIHDSKENSKDNRNDTNTIPVTHTSAKQQNSGRLYLLLGVFLILLVLLGFVVYTQVLTVQP